MFSGMDEVSSVFPNQYRKLHTTKSWEFIGLSPTAKRNPLTESNIIVGLLDTGMHELCVHGSCFMTLLVAIFH